MYVYNRTKNCCVQCSVSCQFQLRIRFYSVLFWLGLAWSETSFGFAGN